MKKILLVLLVVIAVTSICGNALALTTYIPHITGGEGDWTDYLQVDNNTSSSASFTLTLYTNGAQVYSQSFSVGGFSHAQIELKALSPYAQTGVITYSQQGLIFRVSYNNWAAGVAEFKTIDTLGSQVGLYFSNFTNFVQWKGVAIANMGTISAQVTLYALGGSNSSNGGSVLGTRTVTINPKDKIAGIHSTWFNVGLSQIESIVAVTSSSALCGIAIAGDLANSKLLFTPAIPAANFTPPTPGQQFNVYAYDHSINFVNGLSNGLNTNIYLNAGDYFRISADPNDTWSCGAPADNTTNANGMGYGQQYLSYYFNYGQLIGRIGNGPYFLVGTDFAGIAGNSGTLHLMQWDCCRGDNSGFITATVDLAPPPNTQYFNIYAYDHSINFVNSLSNGLNTNIYLNAGDSFRVYTDPNDTWSAGAPADNTTNANGMSNGQQYLSYYFNYGQLIGRIGNGPYFLVGTNFAGIAGNSGTLYLMQWDCCRGDNSGYIRAAVER